MITTLIIIFVYTSFIQPSAASSSSQQLIQPSTEFRFVNEAGEEIWSSQNAQLVLTADNCGNILDNNERHI